MWKVNVRFLLGYRDASTCTIHGTYKTALLWSVLSDNMRTSPSSPPIRHQFKTYNRSLSTKSSPTRNTHQPQPWLSSPSALREKNFISYITTTRFALDAVVHHVINMGPIVSELLHQICVALLLSFLFVLQLLHCAHGVLVHLAQARELLVSTLDDVGENLRGELPVRRQHIAPAQLLRPFLNRRCAVMSTIACGVLAGELVD